MFMMMWKSWLCACIYSGITMCLLSNLFTSDISYLFTWLLNQLFAFEGGGGWYCCTSYSFCFLEWILLDLRQALWANLHFLQLEVYFKRSIEDEYTDFPKSMCHLMVQNARKMTWSIFHSDNLHLLGASVQNMSPWHVIVFTTIIFLFLPSRFLSLVGGEVWLFI